MATVHPRKRDSCGKLCNGRTIYRSGVESSLETSHKLRRGKSGGDELPRMIDEAFTLIKELLVIFIVQLLSAITITSGAATHSTSSDASIYIHLTPLPHYHYGISQSECYRGNLKSLGSAKESISMFFFAATTPSKGIRNQ
ncbi:unnamed protein product [Amoebophrya sp. A120]|nr:unnamed protein product [Amoebophrya sp. A120]|eukprot:GSA120T00024369001.1